MTEAHAQGDIGKYRCQGEEQALPSEASPAYLAVFESKDQLVESQSLYMALNMLNAFILTPRMPVLW